MKNKHAIEVKYIRPTNFRGSRFKLTSNRFKQSLTFRYDYAAGNVYESLTLSYDYAARNVYEMAATELTRLGFTFDTFAATKDGYVILVNEFKRLK